MAGIAVSNILLQIVNYNLVPRLQPLPSIAPHTPLKWGIPPPLLLGIPHQFSVTVILLCSVMQMLRLQVAVRSESSIKGVPRIFPEVNRWLFNTKKPQRLSGLRLGQYLLQQQQLLRINKISSLKAIEVQPARKTSSIELLRVVAGLSCLIYECCYSFSQQVVYLELHNGRAKLRQTYWP